VRSAAAVLALALPCFAGGPFRGEHVEVELLAEHASVQPGAAAWVGVRFRLDPHWHVYWRNAGDSGIPPSVTWALPAGVEAGELLWPAPQRIEAGPFVQYGYGGEVLFPAEIRVPPRPPEGRIRLAAKVAWQACAEVCVIGEATVEIELEVLAAEPRPGAFARLFEETRRRLPRPLDGVTAVAGDGGIELHVPGGAATLAFFPFEDGVVEYRTPQRVVRAGVLALTPPRGASPARLAGVVVAGGEAFAVDAPVGRAEGPSYGAALAIVIILAAGTLLVRRRRGENE
jgi:thiol:disulfide interchange protein DsbD